MSFNDNETVILTLIDSFVLGEMTAPDFEIRYIQAWRDYRDSTLPKSADSETQRFFDSVFTALDSYCSDPELLDEDDLDDRALLEEVLDLKALWEDSILA